MLTEALTAVLRTKKDIFPNKFYKYFPLVTFLFSLNNNANK